MRTTLMTTALALTLAVPALAIAQDAATTTAPATITPAPAATTAPAAAATAPATTAPAASNWYAGKRAEEIVGQDLYGSDGEEIGEINNVVMSKEGNQVAALVGVGGFLGLGEREVAIPLDQLSMGADDRLTTAMTKDAISAMQPYSDGGDWNMFDRGNTLG